MKRNNKSQNKDTDQFLLNFTCPEIRAERKDLDTEGKIVSFLEGKRKQLLDEEKERLKRLFREEELEEM